MRSVKRGRGPSLMSGVGSVVAAVFGVVWICVALSIGGGFIAVFGVVFVVFAIALAIYNFKNASSKRRFSEFDITEHGEEVDPLEEHFGETSYNTQNYDSSYPDTTSTEPDKRNTDTRFCPYCGVAAESDYEYCRSCGRRLP